MASVASTGLDSGTISRPKTVHSEPPSTSSRGMSRTKFLLCGPERALWVPIAFSIPRLGPGQ